MVAISPVPSSPDIKIHDISGESGNSSLSGNGTNTDLCVQTCAGDSSATSVERLTEAEKNPQTEESTKHIPAAKTNGGKPAERMTLPVTTTGLVGGLKKQRPRSCTERAPAARPLAFVSRTNSATGSLGEVFHCPSCHSWNLSADSTVCSACACLEKNKVKNENSFRMEGGRHTKIFRAPDIPFGLKTLSRSPLEILEKKAAMMRERPASYDEADLLLDLPKPLMEEEDNLLAARSSSLSQPPPYRPTTVYAVSPLATRIEVLPSPPRHNGTGTATAATRRMGRPARTQSFSEERNPLLAAIKEELDEKMNILFQLDYLKAKLNEESVEEELKEKASFFLRVKELEHQLSDLNRKAEPTVTDLLRKNEELRKELYYAQKDLVFLRSELDFIRPNKSHQPLNREENILYKLLPKLDNAVCEGRMRPENSDLSMTPSFLHKKKRAAASSLPPPPAPTSRCSVAYAKIFVEPGETTSQSLVSPPPMNPASAAPKVDPQPLSLSQGPCMKFNNLYDLSGQFVDFCKGENGSKFVIERLAKGTIAERIYARSELKLSKNFADLIGQEHCQKVLLVLLEVDKESRQEVLKYIRAHISEKLMTESFQSFVSDYLERMKPGTDAERALHQAILKSGEMTGPKAKDSESKETAAKLRPEEGRRAVLMMLQAALTSHHRGTTAEECPGSHHKVTIGGGEQQTERQVGSNNDSCTDNQMPQLTNLSRQSDEAGDSVVSNLTEGKNVEANSLNIRGDEKEGEEQQDSSEQEERKEPEILVKSREECPEKGPRMTSAYQESHGKLVEVLEALFSPHLL